MNGWKLVPIEPTEEMLSAAADVPEDWPQQHWEAMLAAAPVPPAGDMEVLGWALNDGDEHPIDITLQWGVAKHWPEYATPLVDRAHVTRLQAEVSALQQRLDVADERVDELQIRIAMKDKGIDHRDKLLREFQDVTIGGFLDSAHVLRLRGALECCVPTQSAPAATGESDE